jgi:L-iditol 2-dehydrogenase
MNALQYSFSIPTYLAVRAADRLPIRRLQSGQIPGLEEVDLSPAPLPGPDWARVRPRLAGICGSDISMLTNRSGPSLMPFVSFPLVPGHEVVADITELGQEISGFEPGQRVVINPLISCEMRRLVPCRSCASGEPGLCTNAADGELAPGMLTGFCRDLPGGWSREMIVHRSQLFAIPDTIPDRTAVLIEPFSVAVHTILKNPPPPDAKVLIIGGGSIGLLVLAALRMLGVNAHVTMLARHQLQADMATKLGASVVMRGISAGDAATQVTGAKRYQPLRGPAVYAGGFDWVYDCVGSNSSVDESMRVAGPHGQVMLVGCVAATRQLDLTFVWARELQISGSYVYGRENKVENQPHTFDISLDLIQGHQGVDLGQIVTHIFPLAHWREAMATSFARGRYAALKIAFECTDSSRPTK